jgi:hypothetical protein
MAPKRRLEDLYVVGKDIPFDDGKGEPVTVWLRKLNPIEQAQASRRADAERAKVRASRADEDSPEFRQMYFDAVDFGDDPEILVSYLCMEDVAQAQTQAEAELELEEEWSKEQYLQGLRDAWEESVRDAYNRDPEDPEAKQVFAELQRFADAAEAMASSQVEAIKDGLRGLPIEELRKKVVDQMLRFKSSAVWVEEFRRCEIWLGTFEDDRKTQYWQDREEVDKLPEPILVRLLTEYRELSVDVFEGKDSEATPDSSSSSEPQDEEETVVSSGLAVVSQ